MSRSNAASIFGGCVRNGGAGELQRFRNLSSREIVGGAEETSFEGRGRGDEGTLSDGTFSDVAFRGTTGGTGTFGDGGFGAGIFRETGGDAGTKGSANSRSVSDKVISMSIGTGFGGCRTGDCDNGDDESIGDRIGTCGSRTAARMEESSSC